MLVVSTLPLFKILMLLFFFAGSDPFANTGVSSLFKQFTVEVPLAGSSSRQVIHSNTFKLSG